jgi:hypothetical protein
MGCKALGVGAIATVMPFKSMVMNVEQKGIMAARQLR